MTEINRELVLPRDRQGRYLLTKEAVALIRKAQNLMALFDGNDSNRTYFRAVVRRHVRGQRVDDWYTMPINVAGVSDTSGLFFCGVLWEGFGSVHPIKELVKVGKPLSFEPAPDALTNDMLKSMGLRGQALYFQIEVRPKKTIRGLFDFFIGPEDSRTFIAMPSTPSV